MAKLNGSSGRLDMMHQRTEELFRRLQYGIAELPESRTRTKLYDLQIELEVHHGELQRTINDHARQAAYRDTLTRLPNRWLHMDRLQQCVRRARRDPDFRYAVLFVDFDDFRRINDGLGHEAGDALLVQAARRLVGCLRSLDTVARLREDAAARLGGDEFSILLEGLRRPDDAILVAERIKQHLLPPYAVDGEEVVMSSSVGITMSNGEHKSAQELLREADTAMYRAKRSGKDRHAVFDQQMHAEAMVRLRLETDLRQAVEHEQFELRYQPIVALETGRLTGFEALIRWMHPDGTMIPPKDFIPVAEESGLIVPIGRWVMREACRQLNEWNTAGPGPGDLSMSVNVSKRQMAEPGFADDVAGIVHESGLAGDRLGLEITESVIIGDAASILNVLTELRKLGLRLHMDDFGTGLSSLSCLHEFPIDVLKIDRSFTRTMSAKREYAAVVQSVTTLAHNLDMEVVAEGIETPEQLALMIALECDFGQGYHFSKPVDRAGAAALIAEDGRVTSG